MDKAREIIKETLNGARRPVILWSGGKDSMLLLWLVRALRPDTDILWFREDLTSEQKEFPLSVIRDENLTVSTFAPAQRYYLPNEGGLTLVSEYQIGNQRLPHLADVEHSDRCGLEISQERTPFVSYPWDLSFIGIKKTDYHPLLHGIELLPDGNFGNTKICAPLRDMTDEEVWNAIYELDIPYDRKRYDQRGPDPDSLYACTRCLTGQGEVFCPKVKQNIPAVVWDRQDALTEFQRRFV